MACSECGEEKKNTSKDFTKNVIEINNSGEKIVLFRKVIVPASMGDEEEFPPSVGRFYNTLLQYEINGDTYLYSSDGIPTLLSTDVADLEKELNQLNIKLANEIDARALADIGLDDRLTVVEGIAATAVQPADINKVVMTDFDVDNTISDSTVQINGTKENILTGVQTEKSIVMPVASHTQAGVMNSAIYDAIVQNTQDIANIKGEVVAISGLPASPTQEQLTTAWLAETSEPALVNGAGIFDVTNEKVWTYYTNDETWHMADASSQVIIGNFTNSTPGLIKGSTTSGQIFAESNGTGSVNGWDALNSTVSGHTSKLDTIEQGAEVNVQADWDQTNTSADDYIQNKPIVPVITVTSTDPGEGIPLEENHYIAVYNA